MPETATRPEPAQPAARQKTQETSALDDAATLVERGDDDMALSGRWTTFGTGALQKRLQAVAQQGASRQGTLTLDGAAITQLDTTGAWLVTEFVQRLRGSGREIRFNGWQERHLSLLHSLENVADAAPQRSAPPGVRERIGRLALGTIDSTVDFLSFIGESALVCARSVARPGRIRWRPILFNIRLAGVDALPIVGTLSFLLGIVVAYQGAGQLAQYGANIFVADLVGLSVVREFAPLMTAIMVAGRSGSAYTAQIGTMAVTEEIDAMRTVGIVPMEMLVLPKIVAMMVAMPLLTLFSDVLGVFGGMVMAQEKLGVSFDDFIDRLTKALSVRTYLIGLGKAPIFAAVIVLISCYQGFRTRGGAESVGRQTTRSVVQAVFTVILVDALLSILFSILDI